MTITTAAIPAALRRNTGRHSKRPFQALRRAFRPLRDAIARETADPARDAETIAQFIAWNQPPRLARILRGTAELARPATPHALPPGAAGPVYVPARVTGPGNIRAALELLCTLNAGFYAMAANRALAAGRPCAWPAAGQ